MDKSQTNKFDELFRQRLGNLAEDQSPAGWESLSSKLNSGQEAFDLAISEKLESLESELSPVGWETLEKRIDQVQTDTADKHVKRQLENVHPQANSNGWATLAARLELIAHRRQSLAAFKLTEVSLMLSLLLLFFRFVNVDQSTDQDIAPLASIDQPQQVAEAVEANLSVSDEATRESLSLADRASLPAGAGQSILSVSSVADPVLDSELVSREGRSVPTAINLPASKFSVQNIPTKSPEKLSALRSFAQQLDRLPTRGSVEQLPPSLVPFGSVLSSASVGLLSSLKAPEADRGIHTYLRVFYSPLDLNQVITPQNEFLDRIIEADDRVTIGHSGGILFDIASRHFSLNTGLIYGLRSYIPTLLKQDLAEPLSSPIAVNKSGYSRLTFHTASIPLTINKTLLNNDNWRITIGGGIGLTMVLKSSFVKVEGADQLYSDLVNSQQFAARPGRSGIQERLDARDYFDPEPGWFQGGSIFSNANFFLTGSASFERKMSDRFSIFAAPTISRYLHFVQKGGLGPNYDRIHNHSIFFGTRIRLGDMK
ncbi:MAG: hypothetical protein AAF741_09075 [Bacteroidota bacterium]